MGHHAEKVLMHVSWVWIISHEKMILQSSCNCPWISLPWGPYHLTYSSCTSIILMPSTIEVVVRAEQMPVICSGTSRTLSLKISFLYRVLSFRYIVRLYTMEDVYFPKGKVDNWQQWPLPSTKQNYSRGISGHLDLGFESWMGYGGGSKIVRTCSSQLRYW
jgi:hypothetical protein